MTDDEPEIPFDEPLSADAAARSLGFRSAAAWERYEQTLRDPRRPPPPYPPTWRTRIPAWDIHKDDGGVLLLPTGHWETEEEVTPDDVAEIVGRSLRSGALLSATHAGLVSNDAAAAWRAGNVEIKSLYIAAKHGVLDVTVGGDAARPEVQFVFARKSTAGKGGAK